MYFCGHRGELADGVRRGRARFVAQFARLASAEAQAALPDPCARRTFDACVLDATERDFERPLVALHRDLLRLRRTDPAFTARAADAFDAVAVDEQVVALRYFAPDRLVLVNLGPTYRQAIIAEPLLAPPAGTGWRLAWSSEDPRYGGHGTPEPFTRARLALPAHAAIMCAPDPEASLRVEPPPPSGDKEQVDP
jgi:maltooligosyltrehalose trehalohydrolase